MYKQNPGRSGCCYRGVYASVSTVTGKLMKLVSKIIQLVNTVWIHLNFLVSNNDSVFIFLLCVAQKPIAPNTPIEIWNTMTRICSSSVEIGHDLHSSFELTPSLQITFRIFPVSLQYSFALSSLEQAEQVPLSMQMVSL